MFKKWRVTVCLGLGVALTGAALAFQQTVPGITFLQTVTASLVLPPPPIPTVMQFQKIILKQGASTGWHHHDGPSLVILEKGNGVVETEACGSSTPLQAGTAFAEPPNNVHKVDNFGPGEATIWWATVYPLGSTAIVPNDGPPSCQH